MISIYCENQVERVEIGKQLINYMDKISILTILLFSSKLYLILKNAMKRRVLCGNYNREPEKLKTGIRNAGEHGLGAGQSNL